MLASALYMRAAPGDLLCLGCIVPLLELGYVRLLHNEKLLTETRDLLEYWPEHFERLGRSQCPSD